ncbi:hypothetical protein JB92DRAFT_2994477 [Gautieria morchelliformis]|nr:hypothetical protein JB92DRAFT_2994477 [Gautieria morchelliformis]
MTQHLQFPLTSWMFKTLNVIHKPNYLQNRASALKYPLYSRITSRPKSLLAPNFPTGVIFIQKAGKRGGQDLTNRDVRLSKSVRQKQAFSQAGIPEKTAVDAFSTKAEFLARSNGVTRVHEPLKTSAKTFRGMVIPARPRPPDSDECCMSGCAICVYDLYLTSLETYQEDVAAMRSKLESQNIPVSQWPGEIRGENDGSMGKDPPSELDVSISAFAQLERSLREGQKSC